MAIAKIMVDSGYSYQGFEGTPNGAYNFRKNEYFGETVAVMGFNYFDTTIFNTSVIKSLKFCLTASRTIKCNLTFYALTEVFNENVNKDWKKDYSMVVDSEYIECVLNHEIRIQAPASLLFINNIITKGIFLYLDREYIYSHRVNNPDYRPYLEIEYIDDNAPPVCNKLSPNNTFVDASRVIDFAWSYSQEINTPQSHYDFQYSVDSSKTWKYLAAQVASKLQTYQMPANSLNPGTTLWRVRSYMRSTIVSAWSEAATVLVRSAPAAPLISSITNLSRPTIAWQAPSQQAFELQLLQNNTVLHHSGVVATVDKFYKIPFYLADGEYRFSLRVINEFDLSSDWANVSTIITTTKPTPPLVTLLPEQNGVKLAVSNALIFQKLYVLRDGIPIEKLANSITEWTDYTAVGVHDYVVRGIDKHDNFSDSEKLTAECVLRYDTLSVAANPKNMLFIKSTRGAKLTRKGSLSIMGEQRFFAGRESPVFEFSEHSAQQIEIELSILQRDKIDFEKLKQFMRQRKTLLLRTKKNDAMYGVIASLEYIDDGIAVDCTAAISEVHCSLQISYE